MTEEDYAAPRKDLDRITRAVYDVLCPETPIFEFGHETAPTPEEVVLLAQQILLKVREALTASNENINKIPISEFVSEGYLFEVNRRFLHPLGLALEWFDFEDDGPGILSGVWDYRDDPEGMIYGAQMLADNAHKTNSVRQQERARYHERRRLVGEWVQHVPMAGSDSAGPEGGG